jgi:integrase
MPLVALTERTINALATEKNQENFWDENFQNPGVRFAVRCYRSGRKEFIVRYWNQSGKRPQVKLGNVLSLSLANARKKAREMATTRDGGDDPAQIRDEYRETDNFGVVCDKFLASFQAKVAEGQRRNRTLKAYEHTAKRYLKPVWGHLKVCDIRRRAVLELLESVSIGRNAPVQARRVRAFAHTVFAYALSLEMIESNPCIGLPRLGASIPRDRILNEDEIVKLWRRLGEVPANHGALFKILLLTGQRPGEVSGMRWCEIHGNIWTIPPERSKNKKPHTVPLTTGVLKLLNDVRLFNAKAKLKSRCAHTAHFDEYVFPSRFSGKSNRWVANLFRLRVWKAGLIERCTPHDLRRTAATHLQKLGINSDIIDKVLNHTPQDVTRRHYIHYEGFEEKTAALERWAQEVENMLYRAKCGACGDAALKVA